MISTLVRLLSVQSSAILGPHTTGVIRAWVDCNGEITVVKTAGMDAAAKIKVYSVLMSLAESEGVSPKGVEFL